ncbi:unnamed protein product [Lathyrus sativus]|nr:unnamed protein product [Lathyrus sativus]
MEHVFHMKGGVGETSYANNSSLQRKVIMEVKTILEENMILIMSNKSIKGCWKIVDLGCSSGPNTLLSISNIMNIIHKINMKLNHGKPVFQIYLNDVFENDFNNIFKFLPDFYQQEKEKNNGECFISATPGNFYGRLFPNYYIDIFHSSYSLHWLSKAPKILVKNGEPLNKGNIYISKTSPPCVYEAYFEQFEKDFSCFLKSRFEELALDGMMVVTLMGRESIGAITSVEEVIGMVLNEMVQEVNTNS